MNKEDFTILIQGPLNKVSIDAISHYQKTCGIVVSYWDDDELESELPENIVKVTGPLPDRSDKEGILRDSSFYWAIKGINNGLKQIDTKYVIKTRSDERFEDFKFMMELAISSDKLVCGNIFARRWNDIQYHFGDHVYCCKTEDLLKATELLLEQWDGKSILKNWAVQGGGGHCAEQVLAHAYLVARDSDFSAWGEKENFEKHFHVIDISELGNYIVRWVSANTVWESNFTNHHGVTTMSDV